MQISSKSFKPNLFILGAAKCGTTSLHMQLSQMPEVCMSNPKEPFFFECEYEKGLPFYQKKYFGHYSNEKWIGEARHRNLYLPYVADRIAQTNPDAKLIVLLRNPTERAYSHWWHAFSRGYDELSFSDAIKKDLDRINQSLHLDTSKEREEYCKVEDNVTFYRTYVDSGFYMEQISRYLALFSPEQLHVVLTEDLQKHPSETVNSLRAFIGLPELKSDAIPSIKINEQKKREASERTHRIVRGIGLHHLFPGKIRSRMYSFYNDHLLKRPGMDRKTRLMLNNVFKPHNERLENYLGRDLSHWNS